MRYQPLLRNGDLAKLTWPVALYRRMNPLIWPLKDNPTSSEVNVERCVLVFGFLVIFQQVESGLHYCLVNLDDMDKFLYGVPVFLVQLEVIIRSFHLATHKAQLKQLFKDFYANIYMTQETDSSSFHNIKREMLGPRLIAVFYLSTLVTFLYEPVKTIMAGRRELLYKQENFFDSTKLPFYIPLICANFWVGSLVASILFGELNTLGEFIMHLNGRYLELGRDLRLAAAKLLESNDNNNIAASYNRELIKILNRNSSLKHFADDVEKNFTFRIFLTFSVSAILLCALGFICYNDPKNNIVYIIWLMGKTCELMSYGYLGSILYQTTNESDLMYYNGDWEQIIYCSNNSKENIRLMKLIVISIELNSRPFALTGLKYFRVTLAAVLKILQGAVSYFTFLNSMH